jgi:hypothetical protein
MIKPLEICANVAEPLRANQDLLNQIIALSEMIIDKKLSHLYSSALCIFQFLTSLKELNIERKIKMIDIIRKLFGQTDETLNLKTFQIILMLLDPKDVEITTSFVEIVTN